MYGCIEIFCNKKHGPPMTSANHDISEDVWGHEDRGVGSRMDVDWGMEMLLQPPPRLQETLRWAKGGVVMLVTGVVNVGVDLTASTRMRTKKHGLPMPHQP
jgi:hypothetical protein